MTDKNDTASPFIPKEERDDFLSAETQQWTDLTGKVHTRYVIQPAGNGFEIIDTQNDANTVELGNFKTDEAAKQWLRKRPRQ